MTQDESHITDLLNRMTPAEKVGQLNLVHGAVDVDRAEIRAGRIGGLLLGPPRWSEGPSFSWAREVNDLQRAAVEDSRLKIPLLMARDVIHGHRTIFPIPLGQAASFDVELVERCAKAAAREASAQGVRWNYSPMIDIARDPRWGRIAEGYGEDPHLCSRLAAAAVRGYQGDSLRAPETVAACAKHYVGYGAAEAGRDYASAELSERTLREIYLRPFYAAVKAGAASVMAGIHDLNGVPMAVHQVLLEEILKEEFAFDGLVVSDWGIIADLICHRVVHSEEEAVVRALQAGIEMDMVSGLCLKHLSALMEKGAIEVEIVDKAVLSVLRLKLRLGLFDSPYVDPEREKSQLLTAENRTLAREAAHRAAVLLENRGKVLPLSTEIRSLAVVGPLAEARGELLGTWVLDGRAEEAVSVADGIKGAVSRDTRVITDGVFPDAALAHAQEADAIVAVLGEHPTRSGEAASVSSIELPCGQLELLAKFSEYGIPLIAVIVAGRPLELTLVRKYADAVLYCFHPGSEGGNAVADLIFGKVYPSGKLPVTFPRSVGQVPIYYNRKSTGRLGRLAVRYSSKFIDLPHTPLYQFGYGLSYTEFKYSSLRIMPRMIGRDGRLQVKVVVENPSAAAASEVVQLFVRDEVRSVAPPEWELKKFARVTLPAGMREEVVFELTPADLAFWREGGAWLAEAGKFTCQVGGLDNGRAGSFELTEDVLFDSPGE